jgi:hypothetical protein
VPHSRETPPLPVALVTGDEDTSGPFPSSWPAAKVHVHRDDMRIGQRSLMKIFSAFDIKYFALTLVAVSVTTVYSRAQGPVPETVIAPQTVEISSLSPLPSLTTVHEPAPAEGAFAAPMPIIESRAALKEATTHPFWDRENRVLFAATGIAATGDFFVTRANLASGGRELNPVTRMFTGSTPALASNFALQTAGVMGVSYLFHKTGHHRLERLTSVVSVAASSGAVAYGLTHR